MHTHHQRGASKVHSLEVRKEFALAHARGVLSHLHAVLAPNGGRNRSVDEGIDALEARGRNHSVDLGTSGAVVAWHEAAMCGHERRDQSKPQTKPAFLNRSTH